MKNRFLSPALERAARIATILGCFSGWFGVWFFSNDTPFPRTTLVVLISILVGPSMYVLFCLGRIYLEVMRVRKEALSHIGLGPVFDAFIALRLWLPGYSFTEVKARGERIVKVEHEKSARKQALLEEARSVNLEAEIKRLLRQPKGVTAAEALLRERRHELDEHTRRKATLLATAEKHGWQNMLDLADIINAGDFLRADEMMAEIKSLETAAAQLDILEMVQQLLRNNDVASARKVVEEERTFDRRKRIINGFSHRIDRTQVHSLYGALCTQCNALRDLPSTTSDREFRMQEHELEVSIRKVEKILARSWPKRAQG